MHSTELLYIAVMALVTYLIRVLPLTLIRKDIKNKTIRSFLYYVPYVTLAVMTFPAIIHATGNIYSGVLGFILALVLAYTGRNLITVAGISCVFVLIMDCFF